MIWDDICIAAFAQIKSAIEQCPLLHFLKEDAPIYLNTDASDYGVGAHMFQIFCQEVYHIAFMSKSLTGAQLNWSVKEKECYTIVYALKRFEYLLRGRRFKLFTDHSNLLYLQSESSQKVIRWRLFVQDYDFELAYVKGQDNIVADQLSRLGPRAPAGPNPKLVQLVQLGQTSVAMPVITSTAPTPEEHHDQENQEDVKKGSDNEEHEDDAAGRVSSFVKNRPSRKQYKAIRAVHNSIAGHQGVENTMAKLKQQDLRWQYMRRHVEWFIKHCPECQKLSQVKTKNNPSQFTASSYWTMDWIAMDFAGPHPDGG